MQFYDWNFHVISKYSFLNQLFYSGDQINGITKIR
ncbi:hypothetical protein Barb6XT_01067 [Bacteroidales bacterium Barb6XT]|nr:hypothetical protein Barb6XT_01067 [Bacteroidales bacterium Barb6XT]